MKTLDFVKMSGSGNDFIVIDNLLTSRRGSIYRTRSGRMNPTPTVDLQPGKLAKQLCQRRLSVGADGLLLIEPSKKADFKMRIFNPDGKEVKMCGNGARCVALWTKSKMKNEKSKIKIETKSGIIETSVIDERKVRIKLVDPQKVRLNFNLKIGGKNYKANFINTGVPHVVIFVNNLEALDIKKLGGTVRYHPEFKPVGTNANFVKIQNEKTLSIRTYERGVEDETLACGTGAVAAAIISKIRNQISKIKYDRKVKMDVYTKSGEVLKVYFDLMDNRPKNVWLEGKVQMVYKGEVGYV